MMESKKDTSVPSKCVLLLHNVPVLYEILHVEVIDEQGIPELGVLYRFV